MFQTATKIRTVVFLCAILALLGGVPTPAATIIDRREEKLLLNLDGDSIAKGDKFFVVDQSGKRRAVIEIAQVKEDQAVAHIVKGTLTQDFAQYALKPIASTSEKKTAVEAPPEPPPPPPPPPPTPRFKLRGRTGFLAGFAQNTVKVNLTGASSVNMNGNGFAAEGFYEATVKNRFQILLRTGVQTLKASGSLNSAGCGGSTDCDLNVTYLGLDGIGKYMIGSNGYATWIGGGVSLLYGVSKTSNIVDTSKITFMQKLIAASGAQYPLSPKTFIPLQLEYDLFLNSSSVSAAQIFLRAGYGWRF